VGKGGHRVRDGFAGRWNVRNKANSGAARPVAGGRLCKTKPIQAGSAGIGGTGRAKQTQFPAVPGGTELPGRGTRGDCAKQSQTWEDWAMWARAVIVCGTASPGSETCETKPIRGRPDRRPGADCAKRSQFPAGPGGMGPRGREAIVQNEANLLRGQGRPSPRPEALTLPPTGRFRGSLAKRSQFPAPAGAVRRGGGGRCLRGSQLRKTNPISGGRDTDLTKLGRTRFDWPLSRLRAIMTACRGAFPNPN
jgi:hypothetical protein